MWLTSHFQPLTTQGCCQSRRQEGQCTRSTLSFRSPVGFLAMLASTPDHSHLHSSCTYIKKDPKENLSRGELVCLVCRIVMDEFSRQHSSEKANRLEIRGKIQVLFVFFFNSAVLHPLSLVAYLYVQTSLFLKPTQRVPCFVVVTA